MNNHQHPALCQWAQMFAHETWKRIQFAHSRKGFKIFEVTITQIMLYSLATSRLRGIRLFEAKDEKTNGNDLELFIKDRFRNKYIRFCIQSKISYRDEVYQAINHKMANGTFQIQNLIEYGSQNNSVPLYFLYTYSSKFKPQNLDNRGNPFADFGVSVLNAEEAWIRYCNFPSYGFKTLPNAQEIILNYGTTLHEFLCHPENYLRLYINYVDRDPSIVEQFFSPFLYEQNNFPDENQWKEVDLEILKQEATSPHEIDYSEEDFSLFRPKYRLTIDSEQRRLTQ